jgi:bacteriorhodopsin
MNLLITYAVLEVVAIVIVVSLCVAARRADRKTDRMLSAEEVAARHETVDVHAFPNVSAAAAKQSAGRWLTGLFSATSTRNPGDRSLF